MTGNQAWDGADGPVSGKLFQHAAELRQLVAGLPQAAKELADRHISGMFAEIDRVAGLESAELAGR
jgi:hypothetical protein